MNACSCTNCGRLVSAARLREHRGTDRCVRRGVFLRFGRVYVRETLELFERIDRLQQEERERWARQGLSSPGEKVLTR